MSLADDLRALDIEVLTEDLHAWGHDETMDLHESASLVARPRTTEQVAAVLRAAHAAKVPVTPRGGGTGKAGSCIPTPGGIVLSVDRMDRIKEIDPLDRYAVVEPGVVLWNLHEEAAKHDLWYPVDMSSGGSCLIGGNVACDAGGERAVKYGTTRAQITGVEAVLMDGTVIRSGGKLAKNVAGYALHHLLIGSEGTLGVITEITLKLVPLPPYRRTLLAAFEELDTACDAALALDGSGLGPSAIEFIEQPAVQLAQEMAGEKLPHADAAALLLVELEGFREDDADREIEQAAEVLFEAGARDVDLAKREQVWGVRHTVAEAIKALPGYSAVDAVVPRRRLPDLVRTAHAAAKENGIEVVCFGHAGDGNLHIDFIRRDADDPHWEQAMPKAVQRVLAFTVEAGGSITAEHGVGLLRKADMPMQFDAGTLAAMRALKQAWDPDGLLNPDKVLPDA
ncbi:MAG: FAD-binding oxidoreductase [Planctomycetota bacterium]